MGYYGSISKFKRKLKGGVRGVDYFIYFDATSQFLKTALEFNPINLAEYSALAITLEKLKTEDEFIMCKSMPTPPSTVEVITIDFKGQQAKLPSQRTWGSVDLQFFHTPSQYLYDFFLAWQYLGSNFNAPDGTSSYQSPDAISMDILEVETDSTRKIIGGWLLINTWVSSVTGSEHDAGNNDVLDFTVTLEVEKAIRIPVGSLDTVTVIPGIFGVNVADTLKALQSLTVS